MLGMGTSAAATEARNCLVGAKRLEAVRLRRRKRGLAGDCRGGGIESAGSATVDGSGVLGLFERDGWAADGRKELFMAGIKVRWYEINAKVFRDWSVMEQGH